MTAADNTHDIAMEGGEREMLVPYTETLRTREILKTGKFRALDADHLLFRRFQVANATNLEFAHGRAVDADRRLRRLLDGVVMNSDLSEEEKQRETTAMHTELHGALKQFDEAWQIQQRFLGALAPEKHSYDAMLMSEADSIRAHCEEEGGGRKGTIVIGATDKGPIHRLVDRNKLLRRLYIKDPESQVANVGLYSETAVRLTENFIVSAIFITMVLVPMIGLMFIENKNGRMGLVFGSILLIAIVNTFVANGVQRANLAVVAAYAAVLVVFISSNID